jgi:hypothetical protein
MRQISATSYLFSYWACAVLDAIKKALVARFSALLCKTQCSKLWVLHTGLAFYYEFRNDFDEPQLNCLDPHWQQ